jgi:hypothetical protein
LDLVIETVYRTTPTGGPAALSQVDSAAGLSPIAGVRDDGGVTENVYTALRGQILDLDPATVGLQPSAELPRVWGALMETGYEGGTTATLVCLSDGTTSLYLSTGGGVIGGGGHPQVAAKSVALLAVIERYLGQMPVSLDRALPAPGRIVLRALTYLNDRVVDAAEHDLAEGQHPLSEVFWAGQAVLSELRLIDEDRRA